MDLKNFRKTYGRGLPICAVRKAHGLALHNVPIKMALRFALTRHTEKFADDFSVKGFYAVKAGKNVCVYKIQTQSTFALEYIIRHKLFEGDILTAKALLGENCYWQKITISLSPNTVIGIYNHFNGQSCGIATLKINKGVDVAKMEHLAHVIALNAVAQRKSFDTSGFSQKYPNVSYKHYLLGKLMIAFPYIGIMSRYVAKYGELEDLIVFGKI